MTLTSPVNLKNSQPSNWPTERASTDLALHLMGQKGPNCYKTPGLKQVAPLPKTTSFKTMVSLQEHEGTEESTVGY